MAAGDAVMTRLWKYIQNDGGRVDEQVLAILNQIVAFLHGGGLLS